MLRDRVDLPIRIVIEALKFIPEYTIWWAGLDRFVGRGEELGHLLERWRKGTLPRAHPVHAEFDGIGSLIPDLVLIGPVDPRPEVADHPIERFWTPRPWKDLATQATIETGVLDEAVGALGILPQTRSVQITEDPEAPPRRGCIPVYLDLTAPPTDLERAIQLLRLRYGITERRAPPVGRSWDDASGGWAAAFRIFRLAVADKSREAAFSRLAERAGIVGVTACPAERRKAGDRGRKMAYAVEREVKRVRALVRKTLPHSETRTPTCARRRGTRRRPDGPRENRTMRDWSR